MKTSEEDLVIDTNISITLFSKRINLQRNFVLNYMLENKYIYKQYYGENKERFKNVSFPKFDTNKGSGLFEMNRRKSIFNKGKDNVNIQITPKGQRHFIEEFRKKGII